jgi:putative Ca2+/H+ antiporter (TMEM165/GDT1 family)
VEAFLVSTGVVALAEIGDKSQLLVLALATRFRKPIPIILGMLAATVINHAFAGAAGAWLASIIDPLATRWILGLLFVGIAVWTLIPHKSGVEPPRMPRLGVFGTTLLAFFLMEMGDKTQIATIALAAKYGSPLAVVAGSTSGIMLVDTPLVILGAIAPQTLPFVSALKLAPAIFLVLGVVTLFWTGPGP